MFFVSCLIELFLFYGLMFFAVYIWGDVVGLLLLERVDLSAGIFLEEV